MSYALAPCEAYAAGEASDYPHRRRTRPRADSDVKPAAIPIKDRPPFQSKVGQFSALKITSWVSKLWHQMPRNEG